MVLLPIWKLRDWEELEEIVDLRVIRVHLFVDLSGIVLWCELPVRAPDLRGADSDSVLGIQGSNDGGVADVNAR